MRIVWMMVALLAATAVSAGQPTQRELDGHRKFQEAVSEVLR